MEKKMTYVQALDVVLTNGEVTAEVMERLTALKASLAKKATNRKPTEKQKTDIRLADEIYDFMDVDEEYTISDLIKSVPSLNGLSTSKVTAIVRILINAEKVERIEAFHKAYFHIKSE